MPTLIKPTASGVISDGAKIGATGDTFVIHPLRIAGRLQSGEFYDVTGDGDTANQKCVLPWAFWEKEFVLSGLLVSGSAFGFANLGAADGGVAVTMTFETNHTLAGNLLIRAMNYDWRRKGCVIPIVLVGAGVGAWTETQS
jgi:hypothetical protein